MKQTVPDSNATIDFKNTDSSHFLIGLLSEFNNRYNATADKFFKELSWRQGFLLICMRFFSEPPTIGDMAYLLGSSHQNVKQLLVKLTEKGFVTLETDEKDKRKLRIHGTQKLVKFNTESLDSSQLLMNKLYENVDPADIQVTIRTILKIDDNLKKIDI